MKKIKIFIFLCFFMSYNNLIFSNDSYTIREIKIQNFSCDYDIEKQVQSLAKTFFEKDELENFSINNSHLLNLGEVKGYIIFVEFSEGIMPFRSDYLVELYFDELNNYIKAELLNFNSSPQDRKNYPIQLDQSE